jgi:ADP-ribose pyrophosphatase YjhB (NUDIX family)
MEMPMTAEVPIPSTAVGAVVIQSRKLLLVKRGHDPDRGCWAVPGGKVQWGETLEAAVRREVEEETGLLVEVGDVVWVGEAMDGPDPSHHCVLIDFDALVVGGSLRAGDDADDAAFVDLADVRKLPLTPTMIELLDLLGSQASDSGRSTAEPGEAIGPMSQPHDH